MCIDRREGRKEERRMKNVRTDSEKKEGKRRRGHDSYVIDFYKH